MKCKKTEQDMMTMELTQTGKVVGARCVTSTREKRGNSTLVATNEDVPASQQLE
jgi:hypothetical protein